MDERDDRWSGVNRLAASFPANTRACALFKTSACARSRDSRELAIATAQQAMVYKVSAVVRVAS